MNQPTSRQQILAGILVSGCFLVGAACEQWLELWQPQPRQPSSLAVQEAETADPEETVLLINR